MNHLSIPKPDIILREFNDGGAVLIDVRKRRYFRLNTTASVVWQGLSEGMDLEAIVGRLREKFGIEEERARGSAIAFVESLKERELVA